MLLLGVGAGCSSSSLGAGQPNCTGLAVPAIACAVGRTVPVCTRDASGRPAFQITCPDEGTGGTSAGGAGGASGAGGYAGTGSGGTRGSDANPDSSDDAGTDAVAPPFSPVTFDLYDIAPSSVYIYQGCTFDYTITQLGQTPRVVGRADGCVVCDCAASSCPICGACLMGGVEVGTGAHVSVSWSAVEETQSTGASGQACWTIRALPPGRYRIDIPVYASAADAVAKTGARTASQTFDLPASGPVSVALGMTP